MIKVFAELNDQATRINVHFGFDRAAVESVKNVPGARFQPRDRGGPYWHIPLDLSCARRLREEFGEWLQLGEAVSAWGREEVRKEHNLGSIADANDAKLELVSAELAAWLRPYQRADVATMAMSNVGNFNQPGTGKTVEVIAGVIEADLLNGPHLVTCPVRSIDNVWRTELEANQTHPVFGSEDPKERKAECRRAIQHFAQGGAGWLVLNWDYIRLFKTGDNLAPRHPDLFKIDYNSFTIDEAHKTGLPSASGHLHKSSQFNQGARKIRSQRRYALTGTPMGGKPIRLWGYLNWLEPEVYTSKWRWAETWLEINEGYGGHNSIGGIQRGREEEFYAAHARHLIRRLKREALPGLPPKQMIVVPCKMTKEQKRQYSDMSAEAEARIDGGRVSATNVLAEYSRLRQFANAACVLQDGDVHPTEDSGKLPQLIAKLDSHGIRCDDPEPASRAIVASQSKRMVVMVAKYLRGQGLDADVLTGDTRDSRPLLARFQGDDPKPYLIVMTTETGGISLNMEKASSVHILDESWNPDDQEQLEDRGDRGGRETPLICYYYRTANTIQEYISDITSGKRVTNSNILDVRAAVRSAMGIPVSG